MFSFHLLETIAFQIDPKVNTEGYRGGESDH